MRATVWIPALAILLAAFPETAIAQPSPFQCFANGGVSTTARAESLSEPVGDLVLNCVGGTPTAAGSPIPQVNIQVFLNTSLTSRLLATGQSEALLLVDEPTPAIQRVCGTTGDVVAGGVCAVTGTGTGLGVYNGTAARPNVFQGIQTTSNSVVFLGVPVDPPGASASRVLRITNIRANANALGVAGMNATPTPIVETISPTPPQFLPVSNPSQTVAFIQRGFTTSVSGVPSFLRCVSQNGNLAGDPSQSGVSQFSVRFVENFATAFKRRNVATSNAAPTALANQNDLTVGTYNTETIFFNSGFPAIAGRGNLGLAGLADQGTRFLISFQNVPAGVSLFSQVSATVSGGADVVRRVATDSVGSGPYSPVSGNTFGIAPIPLVGGSGTAAYEVIQSDPLASATVSIPIYVAYDATSAAPSLGTGVVSGNRAPMSLVTSADTIAPVPRFALTGLPTNAFTITDCPSLSLTKTADAASVSAGSQIGFTVTASNSAAAGTVTASDVTLNDPLPAGNGVSWSIASGPANCSIQGAVPTQTLVCTAISLAAGASEAVHVTSATTAGSCASYANTATLAATNASPLTANASTIVLCPALNLANTADAASVSAGSQIGFTVTASNSAAAGTGTASSVTLNDPLPAGNGVSWSIASGPVNCSIQGAVPTQTLVCTAISLAAGASEAVHVTSATTTGSCASYANTATLAATNASPLTANASTIVLCPALNLTKTADAASVSAGSQIGFTVTASNSAAAGTAVASGVTLNDSLPAGNGVSWSIASGPVNCSIQGAVPTQTLVCTAVSLAAGASETVHVTSATTAGSCASYANTATLAATNASPLTANASTTVLCPALNLTNTADAASVSAGSQIGFTVTASNSAAAGTGTASGVTLNDPLPAGSGVNWSIASGPVNCSIQGAVPTQTLVCTAVSLAAGASEAVHVTSATTAGSCASYANTATLAATNASPLTANASTTVLCPAPNIPTLSPAILAVLMLLLGAAGMITVKRR